MTLSWLWDAPAPANPALTGDEVHIWGAALDQPPLLVRQLGQTLSPDEQVRADRFYFELDRLRFIVGRGLLRTILGRYLGQEPGRLRFAYGPYGKPVLEETWGKGEAALCFNVSHAEGMALYALTYGRPIGVDVEYVHPLNDLAQIAERFFSVQENATLRSLPSEQKQEAFFNAWTRKEAYLKACGDGLARPLVEFDVSLAPGEPARLLNVAGDPEEASRWLIQSLTPAIGYIAAVAVVGQGWRLHFWRWPLDKCEEMDHEDFAQRT